jgi:hypothetical protein
MDGDLLGTRRFAVVRDDFDQAQVGGCWGWDCVVPERVVVMAISGGFFIPARLQVYGDVGGGR